MYEFLWGSSKKKERVIAYVFMVLHIVIFGMLIGIFLVGGKLVFWSNRKSLLIICMTKTFIFFVILL
jgi:hypothetical protein